MSSTLVPTNAALSSFIKENTFIQDTVNYVQSLPNYVILRDTLKLLKYIMQQVEDASFAKNTDKKKIVVQILKTIYPDINLKIIEEQIDTLIENKIIKKYPLIKKYFNSLKTSVIKVLSP